MDLIPDLEQKPSVKPIPVVPTVIWPPKGINWFHQEESIVIAKGDCREILPLLEPESIDMVLTDGPFGHDNHSSDLNAALNEHRGIKDCPIANDSPESMREVTSSMLKEAVRILRKDSCACCCCGGGGPKPTFAWLAERMDREGLKFFHCVIVDKKNPGLGWRYRRQYEMVMVAHREEGKLLWANDDVAVPNIVIAPPPRDRVHVNEKNISLMAKFIEWHTLPHQIIIDPFMGSGTTLQAAKLLGRRAIGIELEESHCITAVNKLKQSYLF